MMFIGSHVRVADGIHHGKRGTVASVQIKTGKDGSVRAVPTVLLADDTLLEISGEHLTVCR